MKYLGFPSSKLQERDEDLGVLVPREELIDMFPAEEGELNLYYGRIGSGKTYGATSDIHDDVKRGILVYATWPIEFYEFDDRKHGWMSIRNLLFFRKRYYKIDCPANFHFIDAERGEVDGKWAFNPLSERAYIEFLNSLNHCKLYIDEAWRVIDSYKSTKDFGIEVRSLILVTRHKFRTINLIAQRPTSVQVTARANVNRFFKFVKLANWPWPRFGRYEFQEMVGETVDETQEPISVKTYWGSQRIFRSYNSFFYGTLNPRHELRFLAYDLRFDERIKAWLRAWKIIKTPEPWYLKIPRKRGLPTGDLYKWDPGLVRKINVLHL